MILYHGTRATAIPYIFEHGIKPRGKDRHRNNWTHTVGSNPDAVYLSTCYALHFAAAACHSNEDAAIIEVYPDKLSSLKLQADEDAIEQYMRDRDDLPKDWEMKRRTIYYRTRAHLYKADASLQLMGTCAHRGTIPVEATGRVVRLTSDAVSRLIFQVFDPVISIQNFRFMGEMHADFHRWLFDPDSVTLLTFDKKERKLDREGISLYSFSDPFIHKKGRAAWQQ